MGTTLMEQFTNFVRECSSERLGTGANFHPHLGSGVLGSNTV